MSIQGCHDCAYQPEQHVCTAPTPRPTWLDCLGNWHGRVCPGHEPRDKKLCPVELKQAAFERVTLSWPQALRALGWRRVAAGHDAHGGQDVTRMDLPAEALEEALDVGGYAGLAKLTGRWSWRWALAVLLAGWIARLMMAERGRVA